MKPAKQLSKSTAKESQEQEEKLQNSRAKGSAHACYQQRMRQISLPCGIALQAVRSSAKNKIATDITIPVKLPYPSTRLGAVGRPHQQSSVLLTAAN